MSHSDFSIYFNSGGCQHFCSLEPFYSAKWAICKALQKQNKICIIFVPLLNWCLKIDVQWETDNENWIQGSVAGAFIFNWKIATFFVYQCLIKQDLHLMYSTGVWEEGYSLPLQNKSPTLMFEYSFQFINFNHSLLSSFKMLNLDLAHFRFFCC